MSVLSRILQRILLRLVRTGIRRRRLVLLGAVGASALLAANALSLSPFRGLSLGPSDGRSRGEGEPYFTTIYLKGLESYDARMIWDSYSERAMREAQRRGLSVDDTQRQLDRARQVGSRIEQVNYVGGYPVANGSLHFYVVFRSEPARRGAVPIPYVFTLDANGKVDNVE